MLLTVIVKFQELLDLNYVRRFIDETIVMQASSCLSILQLFIVMCYASQRLSDFVPKCDGIMVYFYLDRFDITARIHVMHPRHRRCYNGKRVKVSLAPRYSAHNRPHVKTSTAYIIILILQF